MDFSGFVGREGIFRHKQAAAGIHLERVAYFMGQYIDIFSGPVKVRKNERCLILVEIGAVAAGLLGAFA
ncbi:hypothetical protein D3C75_632850 [compost metagenome]